MPVEGPKQSAALHTTGVTKVLNELRVQPYLLLKKIDCAAAIGRATSANNFLDVLIKAVVDGEFLTRFDISQGDIQNMPADNPGHEIRLARVVHVLCA